MSSEQIEDIMSASQRDGRQHRRERRGRADEDGENEAEETPRTTTTRPTTTPATSPKKKKETIERTDDPVRMYLREMGAVELLSREGEIAIAKRIEAGRDTMILGLCESPITFHAIIDWSEALNNGEMQLREILDLDAMLSKEPPRREDGARTNEEDESARSAKRPPAPPSRKRKSRGRGSRPPSEDEDGETARQRRRVEEDEEEDNTLSLAQMEAQLKPEALERFASITDLFKKFEKIQAERARRDGPRRRIPARQGKASTRSCARSSPPRSRACSSTRPRSNISSTSSTPSTAA